MSELSEKLRRIAATKPGDPIPEELGGPNEWGANLSVLLTAAADAIEADERDRAGAMHAFEVLKNQVEVIIEENAELGGDRNPRRQAILSGMELPGEIGAMCRLAKVCDFEMAHGWVNAEVARGTLPSVRLTVAVDAASVILVQAILSVKQQGDATNQVTSNIIKAIHRRMHEAAAGRRPPSALHLVRE